MRKMLVRVNPSMKPWTHVSIDPLGLVRVKKGAGGNTKIYPLIICDVNGGITTFEIINSLEAKEVYLALLRVEFRYATKIRQIFSDGGKQLAFKLLGKQTDFYQQKLAALWGVYNNPPYSQYCNYAERQVQSVKRIIKQCAQGKPGVQEEPI